MDAGSGRRGSSIASSSPPLSSAGHTSRSSGRPPSTARSPMVAACPAGSPARARASRRTGCAAGATRWWWASGPRSPTIPRWTFGWARGGPASPCGSWWTAGRACPSARASSAGARARPAPIMPSSPSPTPPTPSVWPRWRRAASPSFTAKRTRDAWTWAICSRGSAPSTSVACSWKAAASSPGRSSRQGSSTVSWRAALPCSWAAPTRPVPSGHRGWPLPRVFASRTWPSAPRVTTGSSRETSGGERTDMFTGIVEEAGKVVRRQGARLVVRATVTREGMELGGSLAVNGVCLTAVEVDGEHLAFDLGPETLARSALGDLDAGDRVNLERPMRLNGFVGGHLVLGHVDGVGLVTVSETDGETARIRFEWQDPSLAPLLIPKGSVAVDGVSLTVAALDDRAFEVMVIPHTLERTTLGSCKPGRRVNLEMDVIGKYVLRSLKVREESS